MSRNYDNRESLVAAMLKREQFRQLCHQDSISTVRSDSDSDSNTWRILQGPVALRDIDVTKGLELLWQMGEGEFATTHLAQLSQHVQQYCGMTRRAVIKQPKKVYLKEDEFKEQMSVLGNCRHENVTTPKAYYYSYARRFVVYDYDTQGSVFDILKDKGRWLSWGRRVKIAVGAARGIAHIHAQSMVHGNIKSSNIFINRQGYGCVSELGFAGMAKMKRSVNEEDDVYSFGVLLLQLVTGDCESPAQELVDPLRSFDPSVHDLYGFHRKKPGAGELYKRARFRFVDLRIDISVGNVHRELVETLLVAKRCLLRFPHEVQPSMSDVLLMVEKMADLRSRHSGIDFSDLEDDTNNRLIMN